MDRELKFVGTARRSEPIQAIRGCGHTIRYRYLPPRSAWPGHKSDAAHSIACWRAKPDVQDTCVNANVDWKGRPAGDFGARRGIGRAIVPRTASGLGH